MNPSLQAGYKGMGPNTISGPNFNPVLVPQAATYLPWINAPWTGNVLELFSGSVQQQQVGGRAQKYYNTNCFPCTTFGATYAGISAQTVSSNQAQNKMKESTVSISEFVSFNNNFQAPGISTPGCHAAGGLAPSGLLMSSNQSLTTNRGQENLGVHQAASSSGPIEEDDEIENLLKELFKEHEW